MLVNVNKNNNFLCFIIVSYKGFIYSYRMNLKDHIYIDNYIIKYQ